MNDVDGEVPALFERLYIKVSRLFNYKIGIATYNNSVGLYCMECVGCDYAMDPQIPIWTAYRKTALDGDFNFTVLEFMHLIVEHEDLVHSGKKGDEVSL